MAKCEYESTYLDLEEEEKEYVCPHAALKRNDYDGKKHCIFHSKQEDKDVEKFYQGFKKLYKFGDHNFIGFVFPKGFDFGRLREETGDLVFKDAYFRSATFSESANFMGATFSGEANFWEATFSGETNFEGATFSGKANFTGAKFLGWTNFKEAIFSEEADFGGELTFSKRANFLKAKFSGDADFRSATFSESVYFILVTFSGDANFNESTFSGEASFSEATFSREADFWNATFSGLADFERAEFSGEADFSWATFTESAYFGEATFSEKATFEEATFSETCKAIFQGKTFEDNATANFQDLDIEEGANLTFDGVNLNRARFFGTDFEKINFKRVYWNNMKYETEVEGDNDEIEEKKRFEKIKYFFKQNVKLEVILQSLIKIYKSFVEIIKGEDRIKVFDETLQKGFTRKGGGETKHYEVQQVYNQLLINYEKTGRYHEAGDFFVGAMEMRRKGTRERWIIRKALTLYKSISLYGERPVRAFFWILSTPYLFIPIYLLTGLKFENSDHILKCSLSNIMEFFKTTNWEDIVSTFYFSLSNLALGKYLSISFDTGLIPLNNLTKFVILFENICGFLFISLFILSMNRKFRRTKD